MSCRSAVTLYKNALLAGAVVGGTLALLCAPKTGEETRSLLASKTEQVRRLAGHREMQAGELSEQEDDARARRLAALHIKSVKEEQMHNRLLTIGFVTGALVGGIVGLLYAPKPGKETREFLKSKAEYTKEEALVLAEHAKQVAAEKARQAKVAAEAVAQEAKVAAEAVAREAAKPQP